jgi:hypothetical protein
MKTIGTVMRLLINSRQVEVQCPNGATYYIRVPYAKLTSGFFKIGDMIHIEIEEKSIFAFYDHSLNKH